MSGDTPEPPGLLSRFTTAERSAILRGSRDACATATDLRATLAELRNEATALRGESAGLRDRARAVREARSR
jgi:hypothetical protein